MNDDAQMLNQEREQQLYAALDECESKGVSKDSMLTLIYETAARWEPKEQRCY